MTPSQEHIMEELNKPVKFITSPYEGLDVERLHIFVSKNDATFIRLLRPRPGTLTSVGAHLWQALCTRCRELGIIDFTSTDRFEQLVQNLVVISKEEYESLRKQSTAAGMQRLNTAANSSSSGRSPLRTVSDAAGQDVGSGPKTIRGTHSSRKTKRSDVQGGSNEEGKAE